MSSVSMSHSDIISLCRLCLAKDLASIDIFETGSEIRQLFTKIVACLPVQVMRDDSLPTKICEVCNSKVDDFYNFWSSTAKNQKQLNDWLSTATDEDPKTDQPTIKIEADDTRQDTDYENDYDDGGGDHDDSDYDAPNAKRIKINASDVEEDLKPEVDTILSEDLNGDQTPSTSTSKRKKSKDQKSKESVESIVDYTQEQWELLAKEKIKICPICKKSFTQPHYMRKHMKRTHFGGYTRCDLCGKLIKTSSFNSHKRTVHLKSIRKTLKARSFECYYCAMKCPSKSILAEHITFHSAGKDNYKCSLCFKELGSRKSLKRHCLNHKTDDQVSCKKEEESDAKAHVITIKEDASSEEESYAKTHVLKNTGDASIEEWKELVKNRVTICPRCNKKFDTPRFMRKHLARVHSDGTKFSCDECNKEFKSRDCLWSHKKVIHLGRRKVKAYQYECHYCGNKYANKYALSDHIGSHMGIRNHICDICHKDYASAASLRVHKIKAHLQNTGVPITKYKCDQCGKEFVERKGLNRHINWTHSNKFHLCKVCGAKIRGNLKTHMMTHTGERPVCCHICGKKLRAKLKEHMLLHTGERPYGCEVCGSTFKSKWYLNVHMRSHNGIRPYGCETCGQKFAARSSYTSHLKKHSIVLKVRGFQCQICQNAFEREEALTEHLQKDCGTT